MGEEEDVSRGEDREERRGGDTVQKWLNSTGKGKTL